MQAGLDEGRKWLISSIPDTEKFFNIIHHLLQSENRLVVSNTALILARLVLAEEGTNFILSSEINVIILQQMVDLIGPCPSGMNVYFILYFFNSYVLIIINLPH